MTRLSVCLRALEVTCSSSHLWSPDYRLSHSNDMTRHSQYLSEWYATAIYATEGWNWFRPPVCDKLTSTYFYRPLQYCAGFFLIQNEHIAVWEVAYYFQSCMLSWYIPTDTNHSCPICASAALPTYNKTLKKLYKWYTKKKFVEIGVCHMSNYGTVFVTFRTFYCSYCH